MATRYAMQQQGVMDGSAVPADKADGALTSGARSGLVASKEPGVAWNSGDVIYLGIKPAGMKIVDVKLVSDTSFGTSTVSIGTGGDPRNAGGVDTATAYVNAKTMTVVDVPTTIGPDAASMDDDPVVAQEHLWATIGTANVAAAVVASLNIEFAGLT